MGVVGYTLGGGLPLLGRAYGFSSDHVRSFDVVTGDGELHHVESGDGSELDWALRGGKGNVGIVTSMEIELLDIAGHVRRRDLLARRPGADPAHGLRRVGRDPARRVLARRSGCSGCRRCPRCPSRCAVSSPSTCGSAYLGDDAEGERLLAPMRDVAPPMIDMVGRMPYAELDRIHMDPEHPVPFEEGGILLRELGPDTIAAILEQAGPDAQCPLLLVEMRLLGGALARGARPTRSAAATRRTRSSRSGALMPPIAEAVPGAIRSLVAAMAPVVDRRHDGELPRRPR